MSKQSITEDLMTTFTQIAQLIERDQAGAATEQAVLRTDYLVRELRGLTQELAGLRYAADLMAGHLMDRSGLALWQNTLDELRSNYPSELNSPSRVLAEGELALLALISYTGAARGMVRERRLQLIMAVLTEGHSLLRRSQDNALAAPFASAIEGVRTTLHDPEAVRVAWQELRLRLCDLLSVSATAAS